MNTKVLERSTSLSSTMKGSGGGGQQSGSSTAPTNTPDTLRSADTVEIILALGEGEWVGPVNGNKSIYVGETVLQNSDNSYNFEFFEFDFRPGLPENTADFLVPKLGGTSNNGSVNTVLTYNVAVVRQMSENQIDAIDLRFNVAQLWRQNDSGTFTTELDLVVEIKKNTDSIWLPAFGNATLPIKGKTTGTYIKELRIPVARTNDFWQIRVTKLTTNTDSTHASDVTWDSYQMINMDLKKYPDTATARIFAQATNQFSSIPQFSGIYKMRKVRVPTNYDPVARSYTGTWDGTFKVAYTENGAWHVYDFVTNNRFGMSVASQLNMDKYEVYAIAQWNDTAVDNGSGGFRPRYTFNGLISQPTSAIEMARYMAGTFNATLFDDNNGTIIMRADMNQDATHLFTPENVTEEGFIYSFTDINGRYNDITVSFKNPALIYNEDRRRVSDQDHIDQFGRIPLDFIAVGCNSEIEAVARANYKLVTGITENMLVSFQTNRLGSIVEPYEIILIADPVNGYGLSGRIKSLSVDRLTVFLRDPIHLEVGINYSLQLRIVGGLSTTSYTVTTPSSGQVTQFTVSPALPSDLPEYCTFTLSQGPGVGIGAPKPFRVMDVEEQDDSPDRVKITAVEVNRNKFTDAETGIVTTPTQFSGIGDPAAIPGPTNVVFSERFNLIGNEVWTIVTVTLPRDQYRYYTGDFDVFSRELDVSNGDAPIGSFDKKIVLYGDTIVNHPPGKFEFKILPRNSFGQVPPIGSVASWVHIVSDAVDVGTPPDPVTGIVYQLTQTGFIVQWTPPADQTLIVHHYLIKEGVTEGVAVTIADNIKDPIFVLDPMMKRNYHLWIYAVSLAGVPSTEADIAITNAAPAVPTNIHVEVGFETLMVFFDRNTEVDIVGYRIRYRVVGDTVYVDMNPNGLLDTVVPDTAYEFSVAAQDALTLLLHDEVWSSPYSVRTNDTVGVAKGIDDVQASTTQNLVRNGSFERDQQNWFFSESVVVVDPTAPYVDPVTGTTKICQIGDGSISDAVVVSDQFVVRANQQYALSCDFRADATSPGEAHIFTLLVYDINGNFLTNYDESSGMLLIDPNNLPLDDFLRLKTVVTIPPTGVFAQVSIESRGTGILYIDGVQAQRGAVATAFNPHVSEELSPSDLGIIANPDNTPPGIPTTLTASGSFRNVQLSWTPPVDTDVDHFDVFRFTSNVLSSASKISSPQASVFADSAVQTGLTYYYWVRAVDTSGNMGDFTVSVSAATIPLSAADFANLSIVNAMIANATIDNAKIASLSADKITAGTITAGTISLGNGRFTLDSVTQRLTVTDETGRPRVQLGKLGSGTQDYGMNIFSSSGTLIMSVDGLGVSVVGTGNLADGAVTADKIVANAIDVTKLAANSVTAVQIATNSITAAKIVAGSITADKLSVSTLSAINANIGTVTAGQLNGSGALATSNYWNLSSGDFSVGNPDGSTYIKYISSSGQIQIKGVITATNATPVNWTDVNGRPTSLADIDSAASTKLGTIATGADVTSANTSANTNAVGSLTTAQAVAKILDPAATINQTSTTINGAKITTGSITANLLSVATLSAIAANVGTLTAGLIKNASSTCSINLDATSNQQFINCGNAFIVDAAGNVTMTSGAISGNLLVNGTITAGKFAGNAVSEFGTSSGSLTITINTNEKLLLWMTFVNRFNGAPINFSSDQNGFFWGCWLSSDASTTVYPNGSHPNAPSPIYGNPSPSNVLLSLAPGTYTFWPWTHVIGTQGQNIGWYRLDPSTGGQNTPGAYTCVFNWLKLKS